LSTYLGKYSQNYDGDLGGDLDYMPGNKPMTTMKDTQAKFPGKQQIIPDRGGWADDFSRGFPAQAPFRGKNHSKY